jgi:hypothetical protein
VAEEEAVDVAVDVALLVPLMDIDDDAVKDIEEDALLDAVEVAELDSETVIEDVAVLLAELDTLDEAVSDCDDVCVVVGEVYSQFLNVPFTWRSRASFSAADMSRHSAFVGVL